MICHEVVDNRVLIHAALGDESRLAIVDLLLQGDLSVHELGETVDLPGTLLAHHLGVLESAGVISRRVSEGDRRRRYIVVNHERLAELRVPQVLRPSSVLFVCSHNSARSPYAAGRWQQVAEAPASSGGVDPAPRVHPTAVTVAAERGVDLSSAVPRGYDAITAVPDLVVSVCDRAREADLPFARRYVHWSIPDPVAAGRVAAFRTAFAEIDARIDQLTGAFDTVRLVSAPEPRGES